MNTENKQPTHMENLPLDAPVRCAGTDCGTSVALVLNPVRESVTHLVVREKHAHHTERLVPIGLVRSMTEEAIDLDCSKDDLAEMEPFVVAHYVEIKAPHYTGASNYAFPYLIADPLSGWDREESEQIPADELAIRRGAKIHATDGDVGQVVEFVVDPETYHITHLVAREGILWGQKEMMIPVSSIDHIHEDVVFLKVDKQTVESAPPVPVKRHYE